jgi:hypothetical protein
MGLATLSVVLAGWLVSLVLILVLLGSAQRLERDPPPLTARSLPADEGPAARG